MTESPKTASPRTSIRSFDSASGCSAQYERWTSALAGTTLLFLGFGLHDADFRVLFRAIKALKGSDRLRRWKHVAVQLNPESQLIEPEAAQDYLESYFGEDTIGKVSIYWERTEVFLEELQKRWRQRGRQ